jgi:hypothetical protein
MMVDHSTIFENLFLRIIAQSSSKSKRSQQSFKLAASFSLRKDLRPKQPSARGVQTFFQATVTNFFLFMSPLQIKFLDKVSIVLRRETGQS